MFYSLIWGNIFSFIASVCLMLSVIKKTKRGLVKLQIIEKMFCILSTAVLNSYPALCTNIACMVRNGLAYKNRLTKFWLGVVLVIGIGIGWYTNNLGYIGYLPLIAMSGYTIAMYVSKTEQQMRYALICSSCLWFFHDIYICAYPGAFMDVAISVWSGVFAVKCYYEKRHAKTKNHTSPRLRVTSKEKRIKNKYGK